MKLITKVYLSIGFILLTFVLVTILYRYQSRLVEKEIQEVLFVTEKLKMAESLQKNNFSLESGLRGYLLSDITDFLVPYQSAVDTFDKVHRRLVAKETKPQQITRLYRIKELKDAWVFTFAVPLIEAKKNSVYSEIEKTSYTLLYNQLVRMGKGKLLSDQIKLLYDEYSRYEERHMAEQLDQLHARTRITNFLSISLTILAVIIGILTAYFLGRIIRKRLKQMIFMADHVAEGKFGDRIYDTAHDEMSQLSESLNVMAARLDSSFTNLNKMNKELDQFAYVVSHDLKAPLRAINNLAEWIEEDLPELDPDTRYKLNLLRGRVHRMENLINGILAYSRIGRKEVPVTTFHVKDLLLEIIDSLAPPPNFTIKLPEKMPVVHTERIFLEQIFTNLIGNAIKYNPNPSGLVEVSYVEEEKEYIFSVTDNGPGIPEKFHDKIFGIFQTIHSRDTLESTGVGLSIVKKIIVEKNCRIWVSSEAGAGATFRFTWPKNNPINL